MPEKKRGLGHKNEELLWFSVTRVDKLVLLEVETCWAVQGVFSSQHVDNINKNSTKALTKQSEIHLSHTLASLFFSFFLYLSLSLCTSYNFAPISQEKHDLSWLCAISCRHLENANVYSCSFNISSSIITLKFLTLRSRSSTLLLPNEMPSSLYFTFQQVSRSFLLVRAPYQWLSCLSQKNKSIKYKLKCHFVQLCFALLKIFPARVRQRFRATFTIEAIGF